MKGPVLILFLCLSCFSARLKAAGYYISGSKCVVYNTTSYYDLNIITSGASYTWSAKGGVIDTTVYGYPKNIRVRWTDSTFGMTEIKVLIKSDNGDMDSASLSAYRAGATHHLYKIPFCEGNGKARLKVPDYIKGMTIFYWYIYEYSGGDYSSYDSTVDVDPNRYWGAQLYWHNNYCSGVDTFRFDNLYTNQIYCSPFACGKETLLVTANKYPQRNNYNNWTWDVSPAKIIWHSKSNDSIMISYPALGNYYVKLKQHTPAGCDARDSVGVFVDTPAYYFIHGDTFLCQHSEIGSYSLETYEYYSQPLFQTKWTVTGGTILGTDTAYNVYVKWTDTANARIYCRIIGGAECFTRLEKHVRFIPQPDISLGLDSICINKAIRFRDNAGIFRHMILLDSTGTPLPTQNNLPFFRDTGWQKVVFVLDKQQCTDGQIHEVYVHPLPNSLFSIVKLLNDNSFEFQPVDTGKDYTYQWTFGDGESSTQKIPDHTYFGRGNFDVRLTLTNGAGCASVTLRVLNSVSLQATDRPGDETEIFPNPFTDNLNVRQYLSRPSAPKIELQDLTGRTVFERAFYIPSGGEHIETLSLQNLPGGVYILKITSEKGVYQHKVLKE